jgi:hypothetical protein
MLNSNLEFPLDDYESRSSIVFHEEKLNSREQTIHNKALLRAKKYLSAEAEMLESIIEVDLNGIYKKFGCTHLTPYCVKYLGLSEDVAGMFVRVARKSHQVPELKAAIDNGLAVTKAKTIASVITSSNQQAWIQKAKTLSKDKLEREVANASPHLPKPEKAKPVSDDQVRVEFYLSRGEFENFKRAQDLVCQKTKRFASFSETQAHLHEAFLDREDPIRKAKRAKVRAQKLVERRVSSTSIREEKVEAAQASGKLESQNPSSQQLPKNQADQSQDRSRPAGTSQRNRRLKKASIVHPVNHRDQCRCQAKMPDGSICGSTRWIDHHHIIELTKGGTDTPENIITLCSSHHRMWHRRKNMW